MMMFKTWINNGHKMGVNKTRFNYLQLLSGGHLKTNMSELCTFRNFSAAASGFDASMAAEMTKFKVSPSAGWWLRSYGVLPSQVTASGPKDYIQKGDVLKYIKAHNLSLRPHESAASLQ